MCETTVRREERRLLELKNMVQMMVLDSLSWTMSTRGTCVKSLVRTPRGPFTVNFLALRVTSTPSGMGRTRCDFRIFILAKR